MRSRHPKRPSYFTDCLKDGDWVWWWILRFWSVCTCVYVRCDPLFVLLFLPFVKIVDQDSLDIKDESRWVSQPHSWAPSFLLKEVETALKACSITQWLLSIHHGYALSIILCRVDSPLSLPQSLHLIPHSAPRETPFKRKIFRTVCSFITSLLHSRSLGLSKEDSTWFSLLNKSIFITLSSVCHHWCKHSYSKTKRSVPPLFTHKNVTILCQKWFWGTVTLFYRLIRH